VDNDLFFKIKQRAIKEIYDNPQGFTVVKKRGKDLLSPRNHTND
jgi:hypothetical protein